MLLIVCPAGPGRADLKTEADWYIGKTRLWYSIAWIYEVGTPLPGFMKSREPHRTDGYGAMTLGSSVYTPGLCERLTWPACVVVLVPFEL